MKRQKQGVLLIYESKVFVRRGAIVSTNRSRSVLSLSSEQIVQKLSASQWEGGILVENRNTVPSTGAIPSFLAIRALAKKNASCLSAIDEVTGRLGQACGKLVNHELRGTLMDEPFVASLQDEQIFRLEFPSQRIVFYQSQSPAGNEHWDPPDLFGRAVTTRGLPPHKFPKSLTIILKPSLFSHLPDSASQKIIPGPKSTKIVWQRKTPPLAEGQQPLLPSTSRGGPLDKVTQSILGNIKERWDATQALSSFVSHWIVDKRPARVERSPEQVWQSRNGSCVAHSELFLELASRGGLPARRVIGLVAEESRFWAHSWVQVEIAGFWYDVEPTLGEAPAFAPRIALFTSPQNSISSIPFSMALFSQLQILIEP